VSAKGGGGLVGLTVHVYPKGSGMPAAVARTDEAGRYRTVPLDPGAWRLTVSSDEHEEGIALTEHLLAIDTEVDLELRATCTPLPVPSPAGASPSSSATAACAAPC
jgi:hypothetical protein